MHHLSRYMQFKRPFQRVLLLVTITAVSITLPLFVLSLDPDDIIITVAGTGTAGYNGDGISGTVAYLRFPVGVAAFGSPSQVLVADTSNHRIRQIDVSGVITTLAGTGTAGSSGDGGPASNAQLNFPHDVIMTDAGVIIFVDTSNNKIRQIDVSGVITTLAGTGNIGFDGDGGAATAARLAVPEGIALDDNGNLIIADTGNHRIRQIDVSGVITTLAGTGSNGFGGDGGLAVNAQLNRPKDMAIDANGNIIIADTFNNRIRQIDVSGVITTLAGTGASGSAGDGGLATQAQLNQPSDVAIDANGNIYIADQFNSKIRMIDVSGVITTLVGTGASGYSGDNGPAQVARLRFPSKITFDSDGNLLIADTSNQRIRKVIKSSPSQVFVVDATAVSTQDLDTNDNQLTITIPPLSLPTNAAELRYTPQGVSPTVGITGGLPLTPGFGAVFQLNLLDNNDNMISNPTFATPLALTIDYGIGPLQFNPNDNISGLYFDTANNKWMLVPVASHDAANNEVVLTVDHFTEFALVSYEEVSVELMGALLSGSTTKLDWNNSFTAYQLWHSLSPYSDYQFYSAYIESEADVGVDPLQNYFYEVYGELGGQTATVSNRVGVFSFEIKPGQ